MTDNFNEANAALQEQLVEQSKSLSAIRSPRPEAAETNVSMLEEFADVRGSALVYPYVGTGRGNGPFVELLDGSVKLDAITGIGVHYFGHGHPDLAQAALRGAFENIVMQGNLQQNAIAAEFARALLDMAAGDGCSLQHCFLTSTGAMANENALKMVFAKKQPASRVLAFSHNFAGRSLGMAHVTDKAAYRVGVPKTLEVDYIPFFDAASPKESTKKALDTLKGHLETHRGEYATMIFELIQGEGGYYPGDAQFFKALMDCLKSAGVGIHIDEIQTFGRTDAPFAFQHFGLQAYPDVVTVGKSTQVCATLFTADMKPPPGLVSQTFTGSTSALFAGTAILRLLKDGKYFGATGKIVDTCTVLRSGIEKFANRYSDDIKGPFGYGGMFAFQVGDGGLEISKEYLQLLFKRGLIAFLAGATPYRIRLLPPLGVWTKEHSQIALEVLESTLRELQR